MLYEGSGLTDGVVAGIGDYKVVDVYITGDIATDSTAYIGIRCSRDKRYKAIRGLSGSGFGNGDMRFVGITISNKSGDKISDIATTAIRINGNNVTTLNVRNIKQIIGIEKF